MSVVIPTRSGMSEKSIGSTFSSIMRRSTSAGVCAARYISPSGARRPLLKRKLSPFFVGDTRWTFMVPLLALYIDGPGALE